MLPNLKTKHLSWLRKSVSLLLHDSYRYMNLKSMGGVKPLKKTRRSATEKESSPLKMPNSNDYWLSKLKS